MPSGADKHLFVVLTEPCNTGCVAIVNFTSIRTGRYFDRACLIDKGEHEFIRHPSYVFYEGALIASVRALQRGVQVRDYIPRDSVSAAIFERICDGIELTGDVPQVVANYVSTRFAVK